MKEPRERPTRRAPVVWERPEPTTRPAPSPLSRDQIVRAAIALADRDGLGAVSLRKVGAALNAGPMRLYGYLSTKEELLDLMADAIYGEIGPAAPGGAWRTTFRALAYRIRAVALDHRWFIDLHIGRLHFGPNALAHREDMFAALDGVAGFENIDMAMQAVITFNAYVIGAIWNEATELRAERESGMDQAQWQSASWPYLHRAMASGKYPMLARIVREATHPAAEVVFDRGLELVLDGIAAGAR